MGLIPAPGRVVGMVASVARTAVHGGLVGVHTIVRTLTSRAAEPAATKPTPARTAIGANPSRRYGSASSRSLAPKK